MLTGHTENLMEPIPARKVRLLIVEDHPYVRAGIRTLLQSADEIDIVGECGDGGEALTLVEQLQPDFILLDMELPTLRGDGVLRRVLQDRPGTRVLVLSSHDDREYIKSMLAGGAMGYVMKDEAPMYLLPAIRHVLKGTSWISPRVAEAIIPASPFEQALSQRELLILGGLLNGKPDAEVAASLELSLPQLNDYLTLLMAKFEAPSREALLEVARKMVPPAA
jgi:two-component system NarL family response regulator